jgi:hypothetical protein
VTTLDAEGTEIEVCGWAKGDGTYDKFVTCDGQNVERDQVTEILESDLTVEEILEIFNAIVRQLQMK